MVMRFRSSLDEQCVVQSHPSYDRLIDSETGKNRVISRKYQNGALCLGVFNNDGIDDSFHFQGPGDPIVCPDVPMEIMAVHPSYTVAWVMFTAGDILPRGAIVTGYWNGNLSYKKKKKKNQTN